MMLSIMLTTESLTGEIESLAVSQWWAQITLNATACDHGNRVRLEVGSRVFFLLVRAYRAHSLSIRSKLFEAVSGLIRLPIPREVAQVGFWLRRLGRGALRSIVAIDR